MCRSPLLGLLGALALSSTLEAQVASATRIAEAESGFAADLAFADQFGSDLVDVGDLDGNGVPELAVGAWLDDGAGPDAGAVYILFMEPGGLVGDFVKITEGTAGFSGELDPADYFGVSLAKLGDLDGDGFSELAVGAYYDDESGVDEGAVYILFLDFDGTVKSHVKIYEGVPGFDAVIEPYDWFGWSMTSLGDNDGDGTVELVVGADGDDDGAVDAGGLYILSLLPDGSVAETTKISDTEGGFGGGLVAGEWFGSAVDACGDLDGDGIGDLLVGADGIEASKGQAWLVLLEGDHTVKGFVEIDTGVSGFGFPLVPGDQFGRACAGLGDLDGNGVPDIAIGADGSSFFAPGSGVVYVCLLAPDLTVMDAMPLGMGDCALFELLPGESFGNALSLLPDYDMNGLPDLGVGAYGTPAGPDPMGGAAWLLSLGFEDCNDNGITDVCDIESGFSEDINYNQLPDECESHGTLSCSPAEVNSTGVPGRILAHGSKTVADNGFLLSATNLAPGEFGYFIASKSTQFIANPGGSDGHLCIGPGFARFVDLVEAANEVGVITTSPDLSSFPLNPDAAVVAGETWYFQCWYRDPSAISNFTDAVGVLFD